MATRKASFRILVPEQEPGALVLEVRLEDGALLMKNYFTI